MPHTPLFRSSEFVGTSIGGRYGDVVEEIDWSVAQIRRSLEEQGLAENTLIVFTIDNGPWLTMDEEGGRAGLLKMGKGSTFEGGVRVPTIFYWPGQIKPGIVSDIRSTLDLFATVMGLAGIDNQSGVDGFNLSGVLLGREASPRTEMPYYRSGQLYAYRQGPWKLHFIVEGAYGQPPVKTELAEPELYNLHRDS
jgi:arylsulfatase A